MGALAGATPSGGGQPARAAIGQNGAAAPAAPGDGDLIRLVIESATDFAIIALDPEGKVTLWSTGAERLLGHAGAEIMGRDASVIFTPEDRGAGAPEAERQAALAHGRAEDERWHVRRDGSRFWGSGLMMPLAPPGAGFVKVMRDRTGKRRTEELLHESETRFRTLATTLPQLVFRSQGDGWRTWGSPQWEAYAGLSDADSRGFGWLDAIHPDDREATLAAWAQAEASGGQCCVEHRTRRAADGQYRWHQTRAAPLRDNRGAVTEWVGSSADVDDMRRLQDRLAEGERLLRTLVEGIPQLVWRAVGEGRWTWASPQWVAYTGLPLEASLGEGWLGALHPGDRAAAMAAWRQAEANGVMEVDYRVRHGGSGQHHWHQARGTPVRDAVGAITEWVGTCTDIDDQMRAREVLARSGEELERLVAERTAELHQSEKLKAIGQLTGGIAHDFNNMLQAITSSLGMVRHRAQQGRVSEIAGYVERAEKGARRAAALTHRLLAFARQQALIPEPVSLDRIALGMEDMVRRTVGPAVQVELKLADGKWLVLCDPNQMESALLNLCVNARDAMPDGGWLTVSTAELTLSGADLRDAEGARPGQYVAIAVTDTGTGMAPEVLAHVFEPFFTTKPLGQGTGLGLSQVYGFVRQSGGIVQVETAPGQGTTVRLCLPFHEHNPEADGELAPDAGQTVLLVEDEQDVREVTAEQLRELGYRVLEAEDGGAALRVVQAGVKLDLLVSDIGLPGGMNGRQLADTVRLRHPGLPVILMTGHAAPDLMAGMEVIRKPFEPAQLADLVRGKLGLAAGADGE